MSMNHFEFADCVGFARRRRRLRSPLRDAVVERLEPRWLPSGISDLTPALVAGPAGGVAGSRIELQTQIDNSGAADSGRFQVQYRLSLDGVIDEQDPILDTVRHKQISADGQSQWTQIVKVPGEIPAGTYHLVVVVDSDNAVEESSEANNSLVTEGTIVIGQSAFSGTVNYLKASRRVGIRAFDEGAVIDPSATTWVVIHGRNESSASGAVTQLASAVDQFQPGDQVLLLDWRKGAKSGAIGGQGENYIQPVAAWAAATLAAYGFTGDKLNLVGYSWGAEIAAEMAEVMGQVNSILAVDAARDYPGGTYNPELVGEVDFSAHANQSWAFFAKTSFPFGSALNSGTADVAAVITGSDHFGIVSLVSGLLTLPPQSSVGLLFDLNRLLTGMPAPIWMADAFSSAGELDAINGAYDVVLIAAPGGLAVESLKYFDGSAEQMIPA